MGLQVGKMPLGPGSGLNRDQKPGEDLSGRVGGPPVGLRRALGEREKGKGISVKPAADVAVDRRGPGTGLAGLLRVAMGRRNGRLLGASHGLSDWSLDTVH